MTRKMPVDGASQGEPQLRRAATAVDIVDHILDKGIVIDYHARVSIGGIDTLATVDARYVVTSCHTHLDYGEALLTEVLHRGIAGHRSAR